MRYPTSMPPSRDTSRIYLALIPLLAIIPILPLLFHGCSCGHDFDFHLMSWFDAARQFRLGNLHPQWAYSPAFNAGEPRFVFYPPLSWYLGAGIGILLSNLPGVSENAAWNSAPILYTWFALTLSGFTMYRLARQYAAGPPALVAATLYLANPYMLFTAYERTAYAELLAAAWFPLLVHAVLQRRPSLRAIAIPLALLWLTNAPAAVIGSYSLALLALVRLATSYESSSHRIESKPQSVRADVSHSRRLLSLRWIVPYLRPRLHFTLTVLAGTGLGLLLPAFYIIPAVYERQYVQIAMAVIPHLRIEDNFLFHHFSGPEAVFHNQVLHTASIVALLVWIPAVALLATNQILCRRSVGSSGAPPVPVRFFAVLVGGIGFLLTPWSLPIWKHAPEAAFLQFPWRALSMVAVALAVASAAVLARLKWKPWVMYAASITFAAALVLPSASSFSQACDPKLTPGALLATFQSSQGTEPTDEYTPVTADNDALASSNPPFWIADTPDAPPPTRSTPGPAPTELELRLPQPKDLILNLRSYPAWKIALDGAPDLQRLQRDDGLIALPLPAGVSTVNVQYARLPDRKIGDIVSLLGLGLLAASALPARWRS
ncbi:MAG: hypothetical protein NVSMB62_15800 [Acidobacteriaceae bacterium]